MIDATPALTITLPIQRRGDPDFRAVGNARHAQVRLVDLGPDPLHPFVQDGERTRIGVDLVGDVLIFGAALPPITRSAGRDNLFGRGRVGGGRDHQGARLLSSTS
jgi:hypothetical protein